MRYRLTVIGDLGPVPDLTRYELTAEADGFYGTTQLWGQGSEHNRLADVLRGFPSKVPASIDFHFGAGCTLRFETADGSGHCCVWATLKAEHASGPSEQFQRAFVCIGFEPATLDAFRADLMRFEWGRTNEAVLEGHAP